MANNPDISTQPIIGMDESRDQKNATATNQNTQNDHGNKGNGNDTSDNIKLLFTKDGQPIYFKCKQPGNKRL